MSKKVSDLKGFARMKAFDPARFQALSSKGGQTVQRQGKAPQWNHAEARAWGKVAATIRWKGHKRQK